MAIEEGGCQAVCSSIAGDQPVLYATGPTGDAQSPQSRYCEGDSSEPLSDGVADLALVSPPANDSDSQCCVVSSSSDAAQVCQSPEDFTESVDEAALESFTATSSPLPVIAEADELKTLESCSESDNVAGETATSSSLMCNNSAGPAVTAASSPSSTFNQLIEFGDDDETVVFPWSPSKETPLDRELTLKILREHRPVSRLVETVNQDNAAAEEDHCDIPAEEITKSTEELAAGEAAEESSVVESETAGTDMDSDKQSVADSDEMEISFSESFIPENVDSECSDLETSADQTFAVLELLESESEMDDNVATTGDDASTAVPGGCAANDSIDSLTGADNGCELDSSDNGTNTEEEEDTTILPPKITAAIVVQSNTSYMGNSSSDDDEDEEIESSDCDSLLGRDSPSPPGVDDSSLFPSVEEVETRTGISFESSGPSCSAPSFGSVAGMGSSDSGFSTSNQADTKRKALTLVDHRFRQIIDVERDLRRYVLHKTNLNRLYQEVREEKLSSHRRQKSGTSHHHHHHSAAQNNTSNLPATSFLSNPSVSQRTPRSSSPMPFGDSSHLNPQSYNRPGAPFALGGEAGSASSSTFCRQSVYSGQASGAQSCGAQHNDCQDSALEPAPKRARLSCPAEEDKENKFSLAPPSASVFGSGGHSYTPTPGAEFYHHQVGCSSSSGAPSSSCNADAATTSSATHYSTGSSNGYYQSQASSAYGTYYNNSNYYANNMSYTSNGQFSGTFGSSSSGSDSNGACSHSSSSSSSSNGNYSMANGTVEANAYNNVSNNNCNNVSNLDRGLAGYSSNLSSSSSSDSMGFRSNNDIIIEHIDEEIRRQNSVTLNNRPASCPPFSSSSSLFSSSIFSSSSFFSQSQSSSQASSSSTPTLYNTGNNSLQYNSLNHFSNGAGWNSSYPDLYSSSSSGSGSHHSSPSQQHPLQPYPCGRSSLMRGGNDFTSVVYSSLLASLET